MRARACVYAHDMACNLLAHQWVLFHRSFRATNAPGEIFGAQRRKKTRAGGMAGNTKNNNNNGAVGDISCAICVDICSDCSGAVQQSWR